MRVVLLVEGDTEKRSVPHLLRRALEGRGVPNIGVDAVSCVGSANVIAGLPDQVRRIFNGPRRGDVAAIVCLLDVKGLPEALRRGSVDESCEAVRRHVVASVSDRRVRAHFAVHEVEAWILGDEEVLPAPVRDALPNRARHPERVNDQEPPSKLLGRLYRRHVLRDYKKIVDGTHLLSKADPARIENTCPHFKALIDDLRRLTAS